MSSALNDLETLMVKAKDMVRLSEELNDRLTAITSTSTTSDVASALGAPSSSSVLSTHYALDARAEPEEATFIRSSLAQLGLSMPNAPVTQTMIKDDRQWTEELARELAGVLQGSTDARPSAKGKKHEGIMHERGIIALDEIWGAWNRARGIGTPSAHFTLFSSHLPARTHPTLDLPHRSSAPTRIHFSHNPAPHLRLWPLRAAHTAVHARRVRRASRRAAGSRGRTDDRGDCSGGADHDWLGGGDDGGSRAWWRCAQG